MKNRAREEEEDEEEEEVEEEEVKDSCSLRAPPLLGMKVA